jgi:hypothetical protein
MNVETKCDGNRHWLVANQQLHLSTWDTADSVRDAIVTDLRERGWKITGANVGNRSVKLGDLFTGHDITVYAERGEGPNTAFEREMQRTCTGRD